MESEPTIRCPKCSWFKPANESSLEGLNDASYALLLHRENAHRLPAHEAQFLSREWAVRLAEKLIR